MLSAEGILIFELQDCFAALAMTSGVSQPVPCHLKVRLTRVCQLRGSTDEGTEDVRKLVLRGCRGGSTM